MIFDYTDVVNAAKRGDENAFEMLYFKSISDMKKIAFKYMKKESDADDAVQETYISIYSKIDTLKNPNAFPDWSKMICRNTCLNMLRRTGRISSAEISIQPVTDDDGMGLDSLAPQDYRLEYNPEMQMDQQETTRLIREILADLPDTQRSCILLWQEQNTTKEIAETLGMPEGTVKSNVSYAKKKIKEKVLHLEKQGTKLYGLAPIPFFIWLVNQFDTNVTMVAPASGAMASFANVQQAFHVAASNNTANISLAGKTAAASKSAAAKGTAAKVTVAKGTAAKGTAAAGKASAMAGKTTAAAAAKTAASAAGKAAVGAGLSKGAIAGVIAAVAVGGGVAGYAAYNNSVNTNSYSETAVESTVSEPAESIKETDFVDSQEEKASAFESAEANASTVKETPTPTPEPREEPSDYISLYANLFTEMEEKYGTASLIDGSEDTEMFTGLAFAKLVDFDKNGTPELVTVHADSDGTSYNKTVDVWGIEAGKVKNLFSKENPDWKYNASSVRLIEQEDAVYLYVEGKNEVLSEDYNESLGFSTDSGTFETDYGTVEDGQFVIHKYKSSYRGDVAPVEPYYIDDKEVSSDEFLSTAPGYNSTLSNNYPLYWWASSYQTNEDNVTAVLDQLDDTKIELGLVNDDESYYETDYFTFTMPEYWKGKVRVRTNSDGGISFYTRNAGKHFDLGGIIVVDASEPMNAGDAGLGRIWQESFQDKRVELWRINYLWTIPSEERNGNDLGYTEDDKELLISLCSGGKYTLESCREEYTMREAEGKALINDQFYDEEVKPGIELKFASEDTSSDEQPVGIAASEWKAAYADFLRNNQFADQISNSGGELRFGLLDINNDDITELMIGSSSAHGAGVDVFTYYNGEVVHAGYADGMYGDVYYYPETQVIGNTPTVGGTTKGGFSKLENGMLVPQLTIFEQPVVENGEYYRSGEYTAYGQSVDEETFYLVLNDLCRGEVSGISYNEMKAINDENIRSSLESN